jgi:uroporphyrinogen decarboxylase
MGVDILFPIQPLAAGMEPDGLKKDFGSDVVFYGGIDVQRLLPFGTEAEVRSEVTRVSRILSKDGGYIMASSHGILKDVPYSNVLAMYDEINKLKKPR